MINKITLIFFLICIIGACGKKGDPEFKSSKKNNLIQAVFINKV